MRSRLSIVELRRDRPTRSTQEDGVFDDVFADPAFRTVLVQQIVTMEIDPQLVTATLAQELAMARRSVRRCAVQIRRSRWTTTNELSLTRQPASKLVEVTSP